MYILRAATDAVGAEIMVIADPKMCNVGKPRRTDGVLFHKLFFGCKTSLYLPEKYIKTDTVAQRQRPKGREGSFAPHSNIIWYEICVQFNDSLNMA